MTEPMQVDGAETLAPASSVAQTEAVAAPSVEAPAQSEPLPPVATPATTDAQEPIPSSTAATSATQSVALAATAVPMPEVTSAPPAQEQPSTAPLIPVAAPQQSEPPQPAMTENYRPLNVRDALSYLDEVKLQFSTQPEVYNRFLDIMKDFKTQNIDTPGVIERVSSLFRGHPALIQGFNTFLPPGYRIECSVDANTTSITVTTPTGTVTRSQSSVGHGTGELSAAQRISGVNGALTHDVGPPMHEEGQQRLHLTHMPGPNDGIITPGAIATPGAANVLMSHQAAPSSKPPLEFNHAISYVNKIKQRFAHDPNTYKQFLEILQTYQRESKPIADVYAQVTQLFGGAPDLLDEFKQFLPDTTGQAQIGTSALFGGAPAMPAPAPKPKQRKAPRNRDVDADGSHAPTRKRRGAQNGEVAPTRSRVKRTRAAHHEGVTASGYEGATSMRGPHGELYPGAMGTASLLSAAQRLHGVPGSGIVGPDELAFFDRCKKFFDDRLAYHEFLKLLTLFTSEIIDLHTLVNKAFIFIGPDDSLFAQFKELVGWDPTAHGLVEDEEWIVDNPDALERPKVEMLALPPRGPSYKRLPASEVDLACSGRDALCWSVLNDDWVAHATWASEGAGAHKKTAYEEALFLSEQERHWYDVVIETNTRAIAQLEPVAQRLSALPAEIRATFRLEPGLGMAFDRSIYERAIKKCYGADSTYHHTSVRADGAAEVIAGLYENPAIVVPVVLRRLKQKDEEWKRARREWNRVWREVDAKNYYRSLDVRGPITCQNSRTQHQGVSFKANDRKATTTRALVSEIEALRAESRQKRIGLEISDPDPRPHHQFQFRIDDRDVLLDVVRLTLGYLDRLQGGFSSVEKDRVESFLRHFVPQVFGVPADELEAGLGAAPLGAVNGTANGAENGLGRGATPDAEDSEGDVEMEGSDAGSGSDATGRRGRLVADDLRKRLLSRTTANAAAVRLASPTPIASRDASPIPDVAASAAAGVSAERKTELGAETTWIRVDNDDTAPLSKRYNFFAGTTSYCLVRLIHMLYHRLLTLKTIAKDLLEANLGPNPPAPRLNPLGVELGLTHPVPIIDDGPEAPGKFYKHTLDMCERLFENEVDQSTFEETCRLMYGVRAFPIFSIDKLISTIIKHSHIANGEARSQELTALLDKDRALDVQTVRQQIAYRAAAESIIGPEEHLYRIEWLPDDHILSIQLLGNDESTLDEPLTESDRWETYRASYALNSHTEGLGVNVAAPLLRRNIHAAQAEFDVEDPPAATAVEHSTLAVHLRRDTAQLKFQSGEDFLARLSPVSPAVRARNEQARSRDADRFRAMMASCLSS